MKREKNSCKKFLILILSFSMVFSALDFFGKDCIYAKSNDNTINLEELMKDDVESILEMKEDTDTGIKVIEEKQDLENDPMDSNNLKSEEANLDALEEKTLSSDLDENHTLEENLLKSTEENQEDPSEALEGEAISVQARSSQIENSNKNAYIVKDSGELEAAKQTLTITRKPDKLNNKITWNIKITAYGGRWVAPDSVVYIWMPKKHENNNITSVQDFVKNGFEDRLIPKQKKIVGFENVGFVKYEKTEDSFTQSYNDLKNDIGDNTIVSLEAKYLIENSFGYLLKDEDIYIPNKYTMEYTFVTYHNTDANLDNVPLGVTIKHKNNNYRRTLISGAFGMAYRNEIKEPDEIIYVDNINKLTATEKNRVMEKVLDQMLASYRAKKNMAREIKELEEVSKTDNFQVLDNGAVKILWKDGTISELNNPSEYIAIKPEDARPPIITIQPENVTVLEKKDLSVIISAKDLEGNLSEEGIILEGALPEGLTFSKDQNNPGMASISGRANIEWADGESERSFTVTLKAKDTQGNIQTKDLTITIKKDISLVPVGVNPEGYGGPLMLILFATFVSLLILKKNKFGGLEDIE